jgi:hypothetical protein
VASESSPGRGDFENFSGLSASSMAEIRFAEILFGLPTLPSWAFSSSVSELEKDRSAA